MHHTKYIVHKKLMIIQQNGRHWYGRWDDDQGQQRSWSFGEEDPRSYLQKVHLKRKPGPIWLSCNEAIRNQLRIICNHTGETQRDALDRLSLQEEARLAEENAAPIQRVRSIGIESNKSISARHETGDRLERCVVITRERLGHITARLIQQEWERCM